MSSKVESYEVTMRDGKPVKRGERAQLRTFYDREKDEVYVHHRLFGASAWLCALVDGEPTVFSEKTLYVRASWARREREGDEAIMKALDNLERSTRDAAKR